MKKGDSIRKRRNERREINTRAKIVFAGFSCLSVLLLTHIYDLQTNQHDKMKDVALGNTIKELNMSPERGDIFDRNGVLLAGTRSLYDLVVIPEKIANYRKDRSQAIDEFLVVLSNFIELEESDFPKIKKKILQARSYAEVIVKSDISDAELSIILANTGLVDGVGVQSKRVRHYTYPSMYLSPIGYVGRVSKGDLDRATDYKLLSSDYTGKMGLEKLYDKELYGSVGVETVALNARGRVVERQIAKQPQKGASINLTIDHRLQAKAFELMGDERGAVVVSDIKTGELLTLLSAPTMDANSFVKGLTKKEASEIFSKGSGRPLYNRAVRGQYPPASTAKPFMAMAAVDGEHIDPEKQVWSGPHYELGGLKFRDWKKWGHGKVDLPKAIAVSSDVYFYKLANSMGIDYIHDYLTEFGFGQQTGIELENEATGLLPSSKWKKSVKKEPWYAGETLNVGIGQGYFMATPIQLNTALSTLLNDGERLKPELIKGRGKEVLNSVNLSEEATKIVKQGLEDVVHAKHGTARSLARSETDIAGKSGTGQVYSTNGKDKVDNEDLEKRLRDHALFIGYAPMDNPEVAVTVFVENGGSGSGVAAPIAKAMIEEYQKTKNIKNDD
ncbi:penicillin-binding protein 2 [Vibrio crassostreae]|uniref:penicillin-binding protein 2 n=1 Tax=Vibrio crassostreae TaxID=246167 RepID=UPI001B316CB7|nr:penicillin-binding protein 2 [Vibrio crassostreae]